MLHSRLEEGREQMLLSRLEEELARQGFTFTRQTSAHRIYHDWLHRPLVIAIHGRAVKDTRQLAHIRAEAHGRSQQERRRRSGQET
jgi:hypothetical protein